MATTSINFAEWLTNAEKIGIFEVVLPFLLIFTLVFAVLQRIKLFGTGKQTRSINVIISLVLALLFVRNQYLVGIVNRFLPNISMFLVVILAFLLFLGVLGYGSPFKKSLLAIGTILSLIFVVWSLFADKLFGGSDLPSWLTNIDPQTKSTVLFVAVFVIVIWFITREDKGEGKKKVIQRLEGLGDRIEHESENLTEK
ncbi:MAG: hypothetical protein PHE43_00140 [Candidatus Nanoarchaeia archaeon]|nr:hypothetical protein [Candidatus Nanoarchaeia archaeon]